MPKQQAQCRVPKYALIEENICPHILHIIVLVIKAVPCQHMNIQKGVLKSIYADFQTPFE